MEQVSFDKIKNERAKYMFKFTEYVPASSVWPTAEDHVDHGDIPGLVRGYNIEVKKGEIVDWMSASWFFGPPEAEYNDEFHSYYFADLGVVPTGRICFRGYGTLEYDFDEREEFVKLCSDEDVLAALAEYQKWKDKHLEEMFIDECSSPEH